MSASSRHIENTAGRSTPLASLEGEERSSLVSRLETMEWAVEVEFDELLHEISAGRIRLIPYSPSKRRRDRADGDADNSSEVCCRCYIG